MGVVGINSPVFYAFEPGTYHCIVTNENGEKTYSQSIVVREGIYLACFLSSNCIGKKSRIENINLLFRFASFQSADHCVIIFLMHQSRFVVL